MLLLDPLPDKDRALETALRAFPEPSADNPLPGVGIEEFVNGLEAARKQLVAAGLLDVIFGENKRDKRKKQGIAVRTVRYYQTKGWIAPPIREKKKGKAVYYTGLHHAQMLAAYLRRLRTPDERLEMDLAKISHASGIETCLAVLAPLLSSSSDPEESASPSTSSAQPASLPKEMTVCDALEIRLVPVPDDPVASAVAGELQSWFLRLGLPKVSLETVEADPEAFGNENPGESLRETIPALREEHGLPETALVQVITSRPHPLDWFADWGENGVRDGVIHLEDYERLYGVPKTALAASYSLLLAFAGELAVRGTSPYELFGIAERGCLFDFCEKKKDVVLKLRSGDICKECLDRLRPLFGSDLLADAARLLDGIRSKVRALAPCLRGAETVLDEVAREVFVHAVVASRSDADGGIPLPQEGESLGGWLSSSGIGEHFGIGEELRQLETFLDRNSAGKAPGQSGQAAPDKILEKVRNALEKRHPGLAFVRIDDVKFVEGRMMAKGRSSAASPCDASGEGEWEQALPELPANLGIDKTEATYAVVKEEGKPERYRNVDEHLRVYDQGGLARLVLHLPDGALVDRADGLPLRGCEAFDGEE